MKITIRAKRKRGGGMMAKVVTKLPCGGKITIYYSRVVNGRTAVREGDVDFCVVPEIHCPGGYVPGKGCAWFERTRKLYDGIAAAKKPVVGSEAEAVGKFETEVFHDKGGATYVFNAQVGAGLVVCRGEVFMDAHLRTVRYQGSEHFECFNYVKTRHGGIISFFRSAWARLTGKGKGAAA